MLDPVARMRQIAPGFYTERDGGQWYVLTPDHDRIAEDFVDRLNAQLAVCWLAGDPLPEGWRVEAHGSRRISYDLIIPVQYSAACLWTRPVLRAFPQHASTFPLTAEADAKVTP